MTLLYVCLFASWLVLTVLWQFETCRERSRILRSINVLHILPIWTFFAPRPGMSDTHILYRDKCRDSEITPWHEIPLVEERRSLHWLWNPKKRLDKLAVDAVSEVKSIKNRGERDGAEDTVVQQQVKLSKGYLILLNIASKPSRIDPDAAWRQFVVVDATHIGGQRSLTPVFFSPFHEFSD